MTSTMHCTADGWYDLTPTGELLKRHFLIDGDRLAGKPSTHISGRPRKRRAAPLKPAAIANLPIGSTDQRAAIRLRDVGLIPRSVSRTTTTTPPAASLKRRLKAARMGQTNHPARPPSSADL